MRKLLLVVLIFILSIVSLVLLFNTFVNTSKQDQIQTAKKFPPYPEANERLASVLRIPTTLDSSSLNNFNRFHATLKQYYPTLFNNPNVEWQHFEGLSLVAKWVGRTSELAPIVLVAEQYTEEPSLASIPDWSFNPFMGKMEQGIIYGQGTQGGKTALMAMLEVFNKLVEQDILPNRTIYFAFPHNSEQGEQAIINALKQAKIHPDFILKTGGLISQDMLWDITMPTALIGIGAPSISTITLESKDVSKEALEQEIQQLRTVLPFVKIEGNAVQHFIKHLSPEMNFSKRLVFSNQWLLSNVQQKWLQKNAFSKATFGHNIYTQAMTVDSSNTRITELQFVAPHIPTNLEQWLKNHLQHPQIRLLKAPKIQYTNQILSPVNNRTYRFISNTCKEVFSDVITAPILVQTPSKVNWQTTIAADIYYFHPVVYTSDTWEQHQKKVDAKISVKNYQQMIQFYYQLINNSI
jgi:carboxypeptidase PM20D1